jgi:hypothetical protein
MAPRKPPWIGNAPSLQPGISDRPLRDAPTNPFDADRCKDVCEMGNVSEMEKFCREYTSEGTEEAGVCWEAVEILRAGKSRPEEDRELSITECRNPCESVNKDKKRKRGKK